MTARFFAVIPTPTNVQRDAEVHVFLSAAERDAWCARDVLRQPITHDRAQKLTCHRVLARSAPPALICHFDDGTCTEIDPYNFGFWPVKGAPPPTWFAVTGAVDRADVHAFSARAERDAWCHDQPSGRSTFAYILAASTIERAVGCRLYSHRGGAPVRVALSDFWAWPK